MELPPALGRGPACPVVDDDGACRRIDSQAWIFFKIFRRRRGTQGVGEAGSGKGSAPYGGQQHLRDVHDLDALGCGAGGLLGRQAEGQCTHTPQVHPM
jgi:hypothetical protein